MNHITKPTEITDTINGVDVDKVMNVVTNADGNAAYARFQFRANNHWAGGAVNRTTVKDFHAQGREYTDRPEAFTMTADEPVFLSGNDDQPNPVEFYLHALAGCLTTSLVYHAAVNGVTVEAVDSDYEGDLDVRGLLGLPDDKGEAVTKGYTAIRVTMRVKSDATVEQLTEFAMFSPVFDMVSKAVPTDFTLEKV